MGSPELPLSGRQVESLRESAARVNIWSGAIRSGKTIASLLRWLVYVSTAPLGGQLVVVGRTRDSAARNVFAPLQDPSLFGPLADQVRYTSGAPTASILGRTVYVLGASDAKAEKVLRGLTCAGAYVDEVTVVDEQFFVQLLGRMSVPGAQLFGTTNPDSPAHWLKRKYLDRLHELPDWRGFFFQLDDNPALSDDYKAAIRREYTGLWFRRFILGEWVAAEGAIYDMWNPDEHVVAWAELPEMARVLAVGIDYGTTNATSAIMLGQGVDQRLYLLDEWRHDPAHAQNRLTDAQLSAQIRAWLDGEHHPTQQGLRPQWIVADPAAASFRVQLHQDGTVTQAADNDVAYGIRTVATLLGAGRLRVSDRCRGWITEAPGYSWDDTATDKGEDKPVKTADHSLDAGRYAIVTTESLWRRTIPV
ncbi:phage terminase, large subunit, PBSX family [Saccharopolyspora antimicrobica]|uniref:PBSX family phage terminase large subunit n=1 Tax=Saccharopolyspora antimicrobica TaxID=455193 RepID=A0A1I5KMJ9_9PSEU|nr:PBSX family phage terminase large subunit [Saccharopolyspora antimicrobica]RKT85612.1 PBSX family phage terminase large subunit [Saccharopolyspora antimicrobica]SFO86270.1 phage terminase, large subunit, PBSX family [Saccharopolyspora antimicrobica]